MLRLCRTSIVHVSHLFVIGRGLRSQAASNLPAFCCDNLQLQPIHNVSGSIVQCLS